jgi:cysteine desulfurase/selenocysteine lyase
MDQIAEVEATLLARATAALEAIPGLRLIGTAEHKAAVLSFLIDGVHPHDAGTIFDQRGVAVRAGHHCAQPAMQHFGVPATVRASLAFYNTAEEIDALVESIRAAQEVFAR